MSQRGVGLFAITLIAITFTGDIRLWALGDEVSAGGCAMAVGGDLTESAVEVVCGIPP